MIFSPSSTLVLFFSVFASVSTSNPIPPPIPVEGVDKVSACFKIRSPSQPPLLSSLNYSCLYQPFSHTHTMGGGKQGQIQCNLPRAGYQNYARSKRIKEGEDYLFRRGGHFLARPLMTEVVSCSWNSAISVMNTVSFSCFFPSSFFLSFPPPHHHPDPPLSSS